MKTDENEAAKGKMELIHISANLAAGTGRRMNAAVRGHEMVMDVRKDWGGEDAGPTPPEYLVIGLGGCILNICRIMAMEKQIALQDLRLSITGDVDPSRAFGLDTAARAGFSHMAVQVEFSSQLSQSEKEEFRRELVARCPLCDTISNPTPLAISFA